MVPCDGVTRETDGGLVMCPWMRVGIRGALARAKYSGRYIVFVAEVLSVRDDGIMRYDLGSSWFEYQRMKAELRLIGNINEDHHIPDSFEYGYTQPGCYPQHYSDGSESYGFSDCIDESHEPGMAAGERAVFFGGTLSFGGLEFKYPYGDRGVPASAAGEPTDVDLDTLRRFYRSPRSPCAEGRQ